MIGLNTLAYGTPVAFEHRDGILHALKGDALGLIAKHEQLASRMESEDLARLLRDDDLPALSHAHDTEQMQSSRRDGVSRAFLIVVDERIEAHIEERRKLAGVLKIRDSIAGLPLGNCLTGNVGLLRERFLRHTVSRPEG